MNKRKAKKILMKTIKENTFIQPEHVRFTTLGKRSDLKLLWNCTDTLFGEIYKLFTLNVRKDGKFDVLNEDKVIINNGDLGSYYAERKNAILMKKEWKKYRVGTYNIFQVYNF